MRLLSGPSPLPKANLDELWLLDFGLFGIFAAPQTAASAQPSSRIGDQAFNFAAPR
jgi:hypothetical protein